MIKFYRCIQLLQAKIKLARLIWPTLYTCLDLCHLYTLHDYLYTRMLHNKQFYLNKMVNYLLLYACIHVYTAETLTSSELETLPAGNVADDVTSGADTLAAW